MADANQDRDQDESSKLFNTHFDPIEKKPGNGNRSGKRINQQDSRLGFFT